MNSPRRRAGAGPRFSTLVAVSRGRHRRRTPTHARSRRRRRFQPSRLVRAGLRGGAIGALNAAARGTRAAAAPQRVADVVAPPAPPPLSAAPYVVSLDPPVVS